MQKNMKTFSLSEIDKILISVRKLIILRLNEKGINCYNSLHECWGILDEEVNEFKSAVHQNNNKEATLELFDIATAAILGIASE